MSSRWKNAWKAVPGLNCGLCSRGICSGFIRAFLSNLIDVAACPLYSLPQYEDARDNIISLKENRLPITGRPAPQVSDSGILFTKPCKDTDEKVMAELRLSNGVQPGKILNYMVFSPELLCSGLEALSNFFQSIKCSKDLGYARADYEEMSITFLNDGRINMRRVNDEHQVQDLYNIIRFALLGSMVCNCCGSDMYSILTGKMAPIKETTHTILNADLPVELDASADIFQISGKSKLIDSMNSLGSRIEKIHSHLKVSLFGSVIPDNLTEIRSMISEVEGMSMELANTQRSDSETAQLICTLMLMHFSKIALQSLEWLKGSDIKLRKTIIENYHMNSEDDLDNIPTELLELYAHSFGVNRAISFMELWLSQ